LTSKPDTLNDVAGRQTLILGGQDFHSIAEIVSGVLQRPTPLMPEIDGALVGGAGSAGRGAPALTA
jgi:hypothetical protein